MPPTIVQRIDFVLNLNQVLRMCLTNPGTNGIQLTLGITDKAEIIFTAEGALWDGTTMRSTSEPTHPCPIPPDCPKNPDCITKLTALMPISANAGRFFNLDASNEFLNM